MTPLNPSIQVAERPSWRAAVASGATSAEAPRNGVIVSAIASTTPSAAQNTPESKAQTMPERVAD